jgi:23S rRNA pseudouridine2605 synthase
MTDKKRKSPRGPRDGGGDAPRRRVKDEAATTRGEKPPGAKEWRGKGGKEAPRGAARRKDDSASGGAKERPSYAKPRAPRGERDAARPRPPRRDEESAGAWRDRPASTQRDGERPPRRQEGRSDARDGAFKRSRDFAAGSSGERPSSAKPRGARDERDAGARPRPPRRDGESAGPRRDRPAATQRDGERPPRRQEGRGKERSGGFERKRDFAASGSGERPPFRKPRADGDERRVPAREGGENAGYRGDRAPRRAEGRDEGFARKRDFAARGAGERPSFAKRRTEDEARGGDRPARKFSDRGARKYAAPTKEGAFEGERIAKAMARAGACSRRDAEQWITEGRVSVNGRRLASPAFNVREGDSIEVDGRPLAQRERTRLFLFHKPPGLVTSAKDPQGRETVFDYIREREPDLPRLMSVGRLDINTQGLLLLSNDGGLARALELPATGWKRRYRVRAHGATDQAALDQLARGVEIEGVAYAPIEAKLERQQGTNVWISMTLVEGKNREVKRVLGHLGLEVTRLIRVSFGPFQLGELDEGAIEEVRLKVLREQLGKSIAEFAGVDFASPLREQQTPAKQQEARAAEASRPRKHVSVLRRERETREAEAPRTRIERATTADRKGRAVQIERVVVKGEKPAAASRNARRFAAERRETDALAGKRAPRDAKARDGAKPSRKPPRGAPKKPR